MSDPKASLEAWALGLLRTRTEVRSLLPEGCSQRQAEHMASDLSEIFRALSLQVYAEISAGRWWLVMAAAPAGEQKVALSPRQVEILAWYKRADG